MPCPPPRPASTASEPRSEAPPPRKPWTPPRVEKIDMAVRVGFQHDHPPLSDSHYAATHENSDS